MPNHVTHRMIVLGTEEELQRFKAGHIRKPSEWKADDDHVTFDLGSFIPMPECLQESESGSDNSIGYELVTGEPYPGPFGPGTSITTFPWFQKSGANTIDDYLQDLLKAKPEEHEALVWAGALAKRNIEETGYASWYEWASNTWGTKWNAYSFAIVDDQPTRMEIKFDTAWACPTPVFDKFAELFPKLSFTVVAFDELWNFAYLGIGIGGAFVGDDQPASDELYEIVYGEPPMTEADLDQHEEADPAPAAMA